MTHAYVLWIATAAYAIHVFEEYTFDWKGWANEVLHLPVDWAHFAIVNGIVVVLGISCASVAWAFPSFSLAFPALMLINATFFHVKPFISRHGRFSPGLITAVVLFYPIGIWGYAAAAADHAASVSAVLVSVALGALLMISPIAMLRGRERMLRRAAPRA